MVLDPITSDMFTGAVRAFHGISDGFVVLHCPSGCYAGMFYLKAFSDQSDVRMAFSCMHARHLVHGADYLALEAVKRVYEKFKPGFIALIDSAGPAMLGDDLDSVVWRAGNEGVKCPVKYFCGAGFYSSMQSGYEDSLESLVEFMGRSEQTEERSINIIGFHTDEPRWRQDLTEIRRMLTTVGLKINSVLTASTFEEIVRAPRASLNVVMGGEGLTVAKRMEEEFSTPYIVMQYPYGLNGSEKFLRDICGALKVKIDNEIIEKERKKVREIVEKAVFYLQGIYGLACSVVGDSCKAPSLAAFLNAELGLAVDVLAITSKNNYCDKTLETITCTDEVLIEPDRFNLLDRLKRGDTQLLFGSTFDKGIAHEIDVPLIRFSFPEVDHISLMSVPLAGFNGTATWIEEIINSLIGMYKESPLLCIKNNNGGV
jgi:nitrogenase molybdenum-iron protein beta chain